MLLEVARAELVGDRNQGNKTSSEEEPTHREKRAASRQPGKGAAARATRERKKTGREAEPGKI